MLTVSGMSCIRLWVTGGETVASATGREKKQVFCTASSAELNPELEARCRDRGFGSMDFVLTETPGMIQGGMRGERRSPIGFTRRVAKSRSPCVRDD